MGRIEFLKKMVYCPSCGEFNEPDANFCKRCGQRLPPVGMPDSRIENFTNEVKAIGRKAADTLEESFRQVGEGIKKEQSSQRAVSWSDATFGVLGPLVWSVLGLLMLLAVIGLFLGLGEPHSVLDHIGNLLLENLLLIFVLTLLLSYSSYASRNYPSFRWLNPLSAAAGIVFALWIAIEITIIISADQNIDFLVDLGKMMRGLLVFVFVIVLVAGYLSLVMSASRPVEKNMESQTEITYAGADGTDGYARFQHRRLYRSSVNRVIAGVCGGIAEYTGIDPTIVRVLWVIGLILSFGTAVIAYLICWIVIPPDPRQH